MSMSCRVVERNSADAISPPWSVTANGIGMLLTLSLIVMSVGRDQSDAVVQPEQKLVELPTATETRASEPEIVVDNLDPSPGWRLSEILQPLEAELTHRAPSSRLRDARLLAWREFEVVQPCREALVLVEYVQGEEPRWIVG